MLDKCQMARLVPLYEGISLRELEGNILCEFGVDEGLFVAALSYWPSTSLELATGIKTLPVLLTSDGAIRYFLQHLREFGVDEGLFVAALSNWPPTCLELATGIKTPPVLLTSDGAIKYFLQHLRVKGAMNLFVRFEIGCTNNKFIDDLGMSFVTLATCKPTGTSNVSYGSSRRGFLSREAPKNVQKEARKEVPKARVVNLEDVEFVREVERVEEEMKDGSAVGEKQFKRQ